MSFTRHNFISIHHKGHIEAYHLTNNRVRVPPISKIILQSWSIIKFKVGDNVVAVDFSNAKRSIAYTNSEDTISSWNGLYLQSLQVGSDLNMVVGNPASIGRNMGAPMDGRFSPPREVPVVWWYDPATERDTNDDATHTLTFPASETLTEMKERLGARLKRAAETYSAVSPILHSFVHDSTKSSDRCSDVTDTDAREKLDIATNTFTQLYGYAWRELCKLADGEDSHETAESIETLIDEIESFDGGEILKFHARFDKDTWETYHKTDRGIHVPNKDHTSKRVAYDIKAQHIKEDELGNEVFDKDEQGKADEERHALTTQHYADARLNEYDNIITDRAVTLPAE